MDLFPQNPDDLKIIFLGIGAIGGSMGALTALHHPNTWLLARGKTAEVLSEKGMTLYPGGQPDQKQQIPVKVIRGLDEVPDPDVVVLGVKLYDLEEAAREVKDKIGDRAIVIGIQNGVAAEDILPKYFAHPAFGIVTYNAWVDEPGVIGYQPGGAIVLGTLDNSLQVELQALARIFSRGHESLVTRHLRDAAHCKLVINLANSVTTLLGPDYRQISDLDLYQDILSSTIYEGVRVIRAAGFHEELEGGLPSWRTLWAAASLPRLLTRRIFQANLKKMTLSSMGQDVLQRKRSVTELEYLNGTLLTLADQVRVPVPYNRAIYRLCRQHFPRPDFRPLDVRDVWREIKKGS